MASKLTTLKTVITGWFSNTALNSNFTKIADALDNTLSRDGTTPNQMEADLDLNGNDLLNAGTVDTDNLYVAGTKVTSTTAVPTWLGAWATATAYSLDQMVSDSGNSYICTKAHTSDTFATDLAASKWELIAQKGTTGAGTGDLLAANDLSDVASVVTSRINLGLEPGVNVQVQDDYLQDIADLSPSAGDVLYFDGTDFKNLGVGTASQVLAVNTGATAPEWVTLPTEGKKMHVQDQKTSGTTGDTLTSGAWRTRTLNTTVGTTTISGASLSANQITLPAGTYEIRAWAQSHYSNTNQTRLYDVTGATTLVLGTTARGESGFGDSTSHVNGTFVLSVTSTLELQHRVQTSCTGGIASSWGTEVYADVWIEKKG